MHISPFLGLGFGVLCLSWAAILIRLADAPSFVIAASRLIIAIAILIPITAIRYHEEIRRLSSKAWGLGILSGLLLAIHFATWISSLSYTSVASSVVLVTTYPIFVGLASNWWMNERVSPVMLMGILIAFAGGVIIGYGDFELGGDALFGDMLALLGALSGAGYFMIGRQLRRDVSLMSYITIVYTSAAILLVTLVGGVGQTFTGYSPTTYIIFIGLALGPQLLGHSSLNWALKYLSAAFVSVSTLVEPVVSAMLAFLILNESLSSIKILGGLPILFGIYLAMKEEHKKRKN